MSFSIIAFTSVTRWLLVVISCAVLETAQLMSAAPTEPQPVQRAPDTVIYPQGSPERNEPPASTTGSSTRSWTLLLGALLLGGAGGWFLIKRRTTGPIGSGRGERKIVIEESRSLGNRQYLVVAAYEGKKFLIGVTPGQIQMLAPLDRTREEG